ncbi:branched-chain amino acid ABC transporter substrate-binding protein [Oryzomicrobium terrae]|uniref:Branched-chain amino acid ABC transporter substrate-binding protein n=1 Tax=Oryzomicrobium terrae TaxID=1735038 RepID=A0A5C1ECM1_9RHOO|nr:branched-chain amino acid ABC transporter substrate-binding protein [Oryzomicrobium terrae]QEL66405.1 branched-chain amino acid ABC transporter substrate-binding protein [Oryzomicrobium terrae]
MTKTCPARPAYPHPLASAAPLALLIAAALAGCGNKEEPKPAATPATAPAVAPTITVRIGHVGPLTGPQAHLGKDNEDGALLAIDDLNAQGIEIGGAKAKFELLSEDDQADPKQGTIVAQKLVDAKVNGIVGHLNSGTTIPASKIYFDAGIPQVSGSATNPKYTQQGFNTAFRVMTNDVQQGLVLGEYGVKKLGAKKIALVDDRTAYGQGLADEVEKSIKANGGEVVAREFTNDKATDFKAILTKIKSKKPDLIVYAGMDAQAGPLMKQLRELGIKSNFLTGDGGCTPEFMKLAGEAAEGQMCSLPGVPLDKMPGGPAFVNKFKVKFNTDIQLYAPYVYDATMVLADAMKRAGSADPAKYLPEVAKTDYQGVTARIAFDAKGDLKSGPISLYKYAGGKLQFVETVGGGAGGSGGDAPVPAKGDGQK